MNSSAKISIAPDPADRNALLQNITNHIRQSLELEEILTTTVAEIRAFLGIARVIVYRFHSNGSGQVIAESVDENQLLPLLQLNFPADDIPEVARDRFLKSRLRSIVHVASCQIGISPLDCAETGKPLSQPQISYRPADPCHIQYLTAMGVQFSLVVPILHQGKLWGLLVSHHAESRQISLEELDFVQQVADQMSIAITQSALLTNARNQATRESTINRISSILHAQQSPDLQAALEETILELKSCGGRLYLLPNQQNTAELYLGGLQPVFSSNLGLLEEDLGWQTWLTQALKSGHPELNADSGNLPGAIADIYQEPSLEALVPAFRSQGIRSLLVIPLKMGQRELGYLTIFSNEVNTEIWWAGQFNPTHQQLKPRTSFVAWKELKQGQPREWNIEELEIAQAIGNQFAIAIQRHHLHRQLQQLNSNLEQQVQERTDKLQKQSEALEKSLDLARVLRKITTQIRSTLDVPTILQTIVREVRTIIDTDRVVLYQFLPDLSGKVVVESVVDEQLSILGEVYEDCCFPLEYVAKYQTGRVRVVDDVVHSTLNPCHIQFLQNIQVKANLVVPIRQSDRLWGLLIAHECYQTRLWEESEIELLQQLADQAAIAIDQAELYQQNRLAAENATQKAKQLEVALDALQNTQSQLIQTEKMSSLGQLVAGIAHEINNPVNFIYGNLTHIGNYAKDLLELLKLYELEFPTASPKVVARAEEIDLDFVRDDLPKILASMKLGVERIRQLVLSLRNFSRLDEAERKPVNIHDGIDSTLLILQHRLKEKAAAQAIQLIKNYGELPLVECYAGQLNQVFMNVLSNAIDALEQRDSQRSFGEIQALPSQISIQTCFKPAQLETQTPASVVIKIQDNGLGMPPEVKAKIFNPFFTTKPVGKGTGLGLSISYQIVVEKHGGRFDCISEPGRGTEFVIEIPLR